MTIKLPLSSKKQEMIIGVYGPTMTSSDDIREKLYSELNSIARRL